MRLDYQILLKSLHIALLSGSLPDLQAMQSMVPTLRNGQMWLGTPPVVLQFILAVFHFLVEKCLFAKNILTLAKWQNVFDMSHVSVAFSGNLSSLTCDLDSLSLLDSLVTNFTNLCKHIAEWNKR